MHIYWKFQCQRCDSETEHYDPIGQLPPIMFCGNCVALDGTVVKCRIIDTATGEPNEQTHLPEAPTPKN